MVPNSTYASTPGVIDHMRHAILTASDPGVHQASHGKLVFSLPLIGHCLLAMLVVFAPTSILGRSDARISSCPCGVCCQPPLEGGSNPGQGMHMGRAQYGLGMGSGSMAFRCMRSSSGMRLVLGKAGPAGSRSVCASYSRPSRLGGSWHRCSNSVAAWSSRSRLMIEARLRLPATPPSRGSAHSVPSVEAVIAVAFVA
jgi:hypothetical protein